MSEFYEGLAEILEIDQASVTPSLVLEDCNWDSLAIVSTIALIDEVYGETVSGEALESCKTVGDLEKIAQAA